MKEWYSASDLAGLPGLPHSERRVRTKSERDGWKTQERQARGGGREYHIRSLPNSTQVHLTSRHALSEISEPLRQKSTRKKDVAYDAEALWDNYGRSRDKHKETAQARHDAILRALNVQQLLGCSLEDALKEVAQSCKWSWATLRDLYYGKTGKPGLIDYHRSDWLAALVPAYTGGVKTAELSIEAWDYFKADFLRLEAPTAAACYERLQRIACERNWSVPSIKTLQRRVEQDIPLSLQVLARQGVDALKAFYPAQERDRSVFHALEAVNADGHKFDVFVKWPDGEITRVVMVAWQDLHSGKVLSWRVDKTENTDSVRLSFGDLVEQNGLPDHVYLDNGRGFASKWMTGGTPTRYRFKVREDEPTGILTALGITVHWATPYHGQAKPIERAFRDLAEYIAKHPALAGAYTGNSPAAKPENYGSHAVPLDKFLHIVDQEIKAHNARTGRRSAVCSGRSFNETFAESYERSIIRKATAEQRRLWLLAAEGVTASRENGTISLEVERRNRYWSPAVSAYAGQKLVVRFDPQQLHEAVHVYTLDGRYIGQAECTSRAGFNDSQAAREHGRARRQFRRATQDQLAAQRRMSVAEAAALLPEVKEEDQLPHPKVVRPYRPPAASKGNAALAVDDEEMEERERHFAAGVAQLREHQKNNLV